MECLCKRVACRGLIAASHQRLRAADPDHREEDPEDASGLPEDPAMRFVNEWLCSISDAAVGALLHQISLVKAFSPSGRFQLLVDLNYLR